MPHFLRLGFFLAQTEPFACEIWWSEFWGGKQKVIMSDKKETPLTPTPHSQLGRAFR